jgi:predicted dehydrogenase
MKIYAGIIGLGFGNTHLQALSKNRFCKEVFLCDYKKKYSAYAKSLNLKFTNSFNKILSNNRINLMCIASYDNHHANQIISSLKKKINIFAEKPICQNFKQFIKIKKLLKKSKVKLNCNFVLRYHPKFLKVKKLISSGKLGKIYFIDAEYNYGRLKKILYGWRSKIPFYSVIQGGAIHMIDLILWLSKSKPISVIATGNKIATKGTKFKFLDNVVSLIKLENGINAKVTANFGCVMPHDHTLKIFGTKGTILVQQNKIYYFKKRDENEKPVVFNYKRLNKSYKHKVLNSFIDKIIKKKKINNLEETFYSMATCLYIEKSIKTKNWEKIIV